MERTWNGFETDLKRRRNGGETEVWLRRITADAIGAIDGCNTLADKKNKKFLERVLHLLMLCAEFLLTIRALGVV